MDVLVTGAGGNLGRVVAPALAEAGYTPVLMDNRPLDGPYRFVPGDVRNPDDLRRAMEGTGAVVHAAALHGIHLAKWSPRDFWDINATGTFNVFEAARSSGVRRVVLCSTMGVYGDSARPPDDAWSVVTEESALLPGDVYGLSKVVSEETARHYARRWEFEVVALRLGMFVPESFVRYGFRLLFGGVDDRDVAQAVIRALSFATPSTGFEAFDIMADTPFIPADAERLHSDLEAILEERFPGVTELGRSRGLNLRELVWGRTLWPVDRAKERLGYRPAHGFEPFLEALKDEDEGYYPFAGLPWWGV